MRRVLLLVLAAVLVVCPTGCSTNPTFLNVESEVPTSAVPRVPSVVIIGDSTTAGTKLGGQGYSNWTSIVIARAQADKLNVVFQVSGRGQSGYLRPGAVGTTFVSETEQVVDSNTRLVVYFGSTNDVDAVGNLAGAVATAYNDARKISPRAKLLVVAPMSPPYETLPDGLARVVRILGEQASTHGAQFLDATDQMWMRGTGMIGADGVHPTDKGHAAIAAHMYPAIKSMIMHGTLVGPTS